MAQDTRDTDGQEISLTEVILGTIAENKKQMDAEINKGGLLRFLCESVEMNTYFCMDLDLPSVRLGMQIDTFRAAVDALAGVRRDVIGRSRALPFDPMSESGDEFHSDCVKNGIERYRALIAEHNPGRDTHQGVHRIRFAIVARLVYGCLRQEDTGEAAQFVGMVSRTSFEILTEIKDRRSGQSLEERFREAVGRYDGKGFEEDKGLAVSMLLDLVDAGYPPALNYIGAMYMNGEYFEKDEGKGFGMISTAAEKGFPKSMLNISRMYRDGIFVGKDEAKADEYEERAIEMRYLPAIIRREMRTGEVSQDSLKALIGFAIKHGAMEM